MEILILCKDVYFRNRLVEEACKKVQQKIVALNCIIFKKKAQFLTSIIYLHSFIHYVYLETSS